MNTRVVVADTLTASIARLDSGSQDAARRTVLEFMANPASPGLQMHRIEGAKDKGFWSIRSTRDIRIVLHQQEGTAVLCYADHHDAAYAWAARKRFQVNSQTGAAHFLTVTERIEEVVKRVVTTLEEEPPVFRKYEKDYLLDLGVPEEWLDAVRTIGASKVPDLIEHLPDAAMERLLLLAEGRPVARPVKVGKADPFVHPDAQRHFRVVDSTDELQRALEAPWEKWLVFLHPEQRTAVEKDFNGPARISGGAGTGKTVVALHRSVNLVRKSPTARVLLTTFSTALAARLSEQVRLLLPDEAPERSRLLIVNLHKIARDLWVDANDTALVVLSSSDLKKHLVAALAGSGSSGISPAFLKAEWEHVIQPYGIASWEQYRATPRQGRGAALSVRKRQLAWSVFERATQLISGAGRMTWDRVCLEVAQYVRSHPERQFTHVIADEAQDLGLAELKLLRALVPEAPNDLLLCGDIGQRIFRARAPWAAAGINIRGRSTRLRLNYRTTAQIQRMADRFLEATMVDTDGEAEPRDVVSLLKGAQPALNGYKSPTEEGVALLRWVQGLVREGVSLGEIGVLSRTNSILEQRAEAFLKKADIEFARLGDDTGSRADRVATGTMHAAKGLEFRAVAVIGCDRDVVPHAMALRDLDDPADIESVTEQERSLLYVACSRARERLQVSWCGEPSRFLLQTSTPRTLAV